MKYSASVIFFINLVGKGSYGVVCAAKDKNAKEKGK
jgi:hypothetical protein